jgi:polysaccharide biosynthesis transport protein
MEARLLALPYFQDGMDATPDGNDARQSLRPVMRNRISPNLPKSVLLPESSSFSKPQLVVLPQTTSPPPIHSTPDPSQRRAAIAAGLAITVTTGALTQVLSQAPVYEGSVELATQTVSPTSHYTDPIQQDPVQQAHPNISPPSLVPGFSTAVLTSPRLLDPVIQRLQLPQLSYRSLVENLTLTTEGGRILVRYQDADPQRVQAVLSQLTQSYISYGQECQGSTCRGIKLVEAQIPQSQARLQTLRTDIERLHQQYGVENLQAQLKLLETRTAETEKQAAQLQGNLAETQQLYTQLSQRLALKPPSTPQSLANQSLANQPTSSQVLAETPNQLLSQDSRYRMLLTQFQTLDQQLGQQFTNLGGGDRNDIQAIQAQHQRVTNQLLQQAQAILPQYLANPAANTQNPIFQNAVSLQLLQQSVLTLNSIQIMQARQVTLGLARQDLERQRSQMISLLGQYDQLRQKLDLETDALQRHFKNLEALQRQAQPEVDLKVTVAPDLLRDRLGQPEAMVPNLQRNLGIAAILGTLVGIGLTAAVERRKSQLSESLEFENMPVDALMNRAKELADMRLQAHFAQVA